MSLDVDTGRQYRDTAAGRTFVSSGAGDARVACTEIAHDACGGVVHRRCVPAAVVDKTFVLDAQRVGVVGACVPGLVALANQLGDLAIRASHNVVRADLRSRIAQPGDCTGVAALGGVDHCLADRVAASRRIIG